MVAAKGNKEIGDRFNKIIGQLADDNDSLKGAINVADFNDEEKLGKGHPAGREFGICLTMRRWGMRSVKTERQAQGGG